MTYVSQYPPAGTDPQALLNRPAAPAADFNSYVLPGTVEMTRTNQVTYRGPADSAAMFYGPQLPQQASVPQQAYLPQQFSAPQQSYTPLQYGSPLQQQLDLSRNAPTTAERGDALGATIDRIMAMLLGSTAMPGQAGQAGQGEAMLNDSMTGLENALVQAGVGGSAGGAPGSNAGGPVLTPAVEPVAPGATLEPDSAAEPERKLVKLEGNELSGAVSANGRGISSSKDGLGIDGGRLDSEIGAGETMTFDAPGGLANGATLEISALFGNEKITGQERGVIEVVRPDGSVEEVPFNGTTDGKQTVEIDGPFTQLRIRAEQPDHLKGNYKIEDSDFKLKSIEYGEATAADKADAADASKAANTTEAGNVVEEVTYSGDQLTGMLDAGGKGIKLKDGKIGVDGGVNDRQIGAGEAVTFRPEGGLADGATIDVANLSADNKSGQERGVIEVVRPDGTVEEVAFNGTESGDQTVKIEGEFTELRIKPTQFDGGDEKTKISNGFFGIGKKYEDSDFSIRSISVGNITEAKPEGGAQPGAPDGAAPGGGTPADGQLVANPNQPMMLDMSSLMQATQALSQVKDLIDGSPLDEGQKQAARQALAPALQTIEAAMQPGSDGGSAITAAEIAQLLGDVKAIIPIAKALGGELGNAIMASLATGIEGITNAVLAGTQPTATPALDTQPIPGPDVPNAAPPAPETPTTPQTAIA